MRILKIGEFSKLIGKSTQTLRRWEEEGILLPNHKTPSGIRYYTEKQYLDFLNIDRGIKKRNIGYCRVSSYKQKDDLERQVSNMETYLISKGTPFEIIEDIGSGINYKNKGLTKLIELIIKGEVEKIVVLYKDRLVRFGFELIELLCKQFNTEIEVISSKEKDIQEELVEDLVQIITVFSCRLQGRRANKTKDLIKDLIEEDEKRNQSKTSSHKGTRRIIKKVHRL
jgi:predicted site-specific integrase-resolvase